MLFSKSIDTMSSALNAYDLRHRIISNNVANAETPDYKRKDVKFDEILKNQLSGSANLQGMITNQRHIGINDLDKDLNPSVYVDKSTKSRLDGNNVDIDVEMGELSKNYIKYNMVAQQISGSFKKIKMAIGEGRG